MLNKLQKFLVCNNILSNIQHGFRPKYSTTTAMTQFLNYVTDALNKKELF